MLIRAANRAFAPLLRGADALCCIDGRLVVAASAAGSVLRLARARRAGPKTAASALLQSGFITESHRVLAQAAGCIRRVRLGTFSGSVPDRLQRFVPAAPPGSATAVERLASAILASGDAFRVIAESIGAASSGYPPDSSPLPATRSTPLHDADSLTAASPFPGSFDIRSSPASALVSDPPPAGEHVPLRGAAVLPVELECLALDVVSALVPRVEPVAHLEAFAVIVRSFARSALEQYRSSAVQVESPSLVLDFLRSAHTAAMRCFDAAVLAALAEDTARRQLLLDDPCALLRHLYARAAGRHGEAGVPPGSGLAEAFERIQRAFSPRF